MSRLILPLTEALLQMPRSGVRSLNCHKEDARSEENQASIITGFVFRSGADPEADALDRRSAIGAPQLGQAGALSDTDLPHSGHEIRAISRHGTEMARRVSPYAPFRQAEPLQPFQHSSKSASQIEAWSQVIGRDYEGRKRACTQLELPRRAAD